MHLVQGILLALLQREKTGARPAGQRVALQLDARDADAGSGDDHDARTPRSTGRAMPLSGVFETADGALVLVGAFKANPLQRHLHGARACRPVARSALRQPATRSSRNKPELQAIVPRALQDATRRRTGSRGSKSRTCCARRCATSPRRWPTSRRCINGMILEAQRARSSTRAGRRLADPRCRRAGARCAARRRELGEHTDEVLAEARASLRERGRVMTDPLRRRRTTSPASRIDRPEVLNAIDLADRGASCSASGTRSSSDRDVRVRRAHRRRRARLLRRRRHEERQRQPERARILGRAAARRLRRHRAARDARTCR